LYFVFLFVQKMTIGSEIRYNRTRLAPTPSGFLHLGNVLSFVITIAIAKQAGAKVLLRIDDMDRDRVNRQYIQDIFDTLNFLEIQWDEGPGDAVEFEDSWSQRCRMKMYDEAMEKLRKKGTVFACTCSRQQIRELKPCTCLDKHLPLDTEGSAWKLITEDREMIIKGHNGKIIHARLPPDMHNFIVKRKDGLPAYQLTSVVDDLFYDVDLVVRGDDLWPSTLAQHMLAFMLHENAFNNIAFYHHPLLMAGRDKKLSKSAGSTSVRYLRQSGEKPSDIFALIGAMLHIDQDIRSMEQLVEALLHSF
jgi:glutamyl-tRNA synthetase